MAGPSVSQDPVLLWEVWAKAGPGGWAQRHDGHCGVPWALCPWSDAVPAALGAPLRAVLTVGREETVGHQRQGCVSGPSMAVPQAAGPGAARSQLHSRIPWIRESTAKTSKLFME